MRGCQFECALRVVNAVSSPWRVAFVQGALLSPLHHGQVRAFTAPLANSGVNVKTWWIPLSLACALLSTSALAEMLSVKVDRANFRDGPSTTAPVLYTADKYFAVQVVERQKEWVKTKDFEGDIAWVAAHLLENTSAVVVHVESALVRQGPDKQNAVVFKVGRGEGVRVLGRQGSWLQVTNVDDEKGWIHRDVVWGDTAP